MKTLIKLFGVTLVVTCLSSAIADDHHHRHFAKDVNAFHEVLAPVWHARPSPERLPDACAKVEELGRLASDIRSTDATKLVASIAAMKTACQSKGDVDGTFHDVHEAFHYLIG